MIRKSGILALAAVASLATAAPSFAQGIEIGPNGVRVIPQSELRRERNDDNRGLRTSSRQEAQGISEKQALRIARRQGVEEVDSVTRTRSAYRIAGIDDRGDDIRVDIDIRDGAVIAVR